MPSSAAVSQMLTASSTAVGLESVTSALHPERSFDAVAAHVNQVSADNSRACLAARVDAQGGADLLLPAGLVNVAMQAEQRAYLLHRLQHARRADRAPHQVTCRGLEPQVLVEDRRGVQAGPVGRAVDKKDRSSGIFGLVGEGVDLLADQAKDPGRTIFLIHCPPYGSGLDTAPVLDQNLRLQASAGDLMRGPVGSTGVLEAVQQVRPLLSLHGHIHESGGEKKIGPTLCVNPGSEAGSGIVRGYLIDVSSDGVERSFRVEG